MESKAAQLTRGEHYLLWNLKVKTLCSEIAFSDEKLRISGGQQLMNREEIHAKFKLGMYIIYAVLAG